jgi:hypothetical protein
MFENKMLKRIFGLQGQEVRGRPRKLHNGELRNLHASQNIIRTMKSRKMG